MDKELNTDIKAALLSIGSAQVDKSLLPDKLESKATAGPGAGGSSIFLKSGNQRVRLTINDASPLRVVPEDEHVVVLKNDDVVARGVLERPLCHCPEQAYITLSEKCVYDCQFCPVPKMHGGVKDSAKVIQMVEEAYATGELKAISFTSGIAVSPKKEVQRAVSIIKQLTSEYDLPIGVSVYPTTGSSEELYSAGACEIKYNVETMDPELFRRFCPDLSLYTILDALDTAVNVFGKNRVSSNFIIGLGESDETVRKGIKLLTNRCIIPILRPISPHPLRKNVKITRPDSARLLKLGSMLKDMLDHESLCVDKSRTMCLLCTGCDLTPHKDI
ncbi:Biotin synthase-related enzyme [Methanosarcina barkeri 3]|uniref:Biotin synthase-related enzyme n=1 Tax=Methanosarcina barkeri 3 TaxID=1434107 RepID=A0A0E3SKG7_METBA|nr:radical SAM protein [Methanosarcina barkeri]AKB81427.1 Biotin synthase-related enzyme [Methanosarcina barkeri 3]